jgi:hypothetical protein
MSAGDIKPVRPIADATVLVFGAKDSEPAYRQPFRAVAEKRTSSHVALRVRFSDQDLYNKYIKGTDIPCAKYTENGQQVYEAYLSFGPTGSGFVSSGSALGEFWADEISSQILKPAPRTTGKAKTAKIMKADLMKADFALRAPVLDLIPNVRNLYPQSMLKGNSAEEDKYILQFQNKIQQALVKYEKDQAREIVAVQMIRAISGNNSSAYATYLATVKDALMELKGQLYPNRHDMDINSFVHELENRGSIGLPPRASETIQCVAPGQGGQSNDPKVENILEFMRFVNDNKARIPYVFPSLNCADMVKAALTHDQNPTFVRAFAPTLESRILGLPLSVMSLGRFGDHLTTPVETVRDAEAWNISRAQQTAALKDMDMHHVAKDVKASKTGVKPHAAKRPHEADPKSQGSVSGGAHHAYDDAPEHHDDAVMHKRHRSSISIPKPTPPGTRTS